MQPALDNNIEEIEDTMRRQKVKIAGVEEHISGIKASKYLQQNNSDIK